MNTNGREVLLCILRLTTINAPNNTPRTTKIMITTRIFEVESESSSLLLPSEEESGIVGEGVGVGVGIGVGFGVKSALNSTSHSASVPCSSVIVHDDVVMPF